MSVGAPVGRCDGGDVVREYAASRLGADARARFEEHFFGCDACWSELGDAIAIRAVLARARLVDEETETLESLPPPADDRPVQGTPRSRSSRLWIWTCGLVLVAALAAGAKWLPRPPEEQPPSQRVLVLGETALDFAVRVRIAGDRVVPSWPLVHGAQSYEVEIRDRSGGEILRRTTDETSIEVPRDRIEAGGLFYCHVAALDAAGTVLIESSLQGISIAPLDEP